MIRRFAILLAIPVCATTLITSNAHAAELTAPAAPTASLHAALAEVASSVSMRGARDALRAAKPAWATPSQPVTLPEFRAAVTALRQQVASLAPTTDDELAAKALLDYWTNDPNYESTIHDFLMGTAWAADQNITQPVTGMDAVSWAVHGLVDEGSLSISTGFWSRVAHIVVVVLAVTAVVATCSTLVAPACVGALLLTTGALQADALLTINEEAANARSAEGSLTYNTECVSDNLCDINHVVAASPSHTMVSFSAHWVTIRSPSVEAESIAYGCGGFAGGDVTPNTGLALSRCFTHTPISSGTHLYQGNTNWYDYFISSDYGYSQFVCAAQVGVDVVATWSNGTRAHVAATASKVPRTC